MDQPKRAAMISTLLEHVDEVVRQRGHEGAWEALWPVVAGDRLAWPMSVCPPDKAGRLLLFVGRAVHGAAHCAIDLPRQVRN